MEALILPDGSAIASGVWGEPAILSVRWTQDRNTKQEITLGTVCCASLEIQLFSPKKPEIPVGTRLIFQEDGITRGVFYCQGLTRLSQNRWSLKALDGMQRFYRELGEFWQDRAEDTVLSLLLGLCGYCGVSTAITQLPGGDLPLPNLAGYTAKNILRYLAQVTGRFFYMDKEENLCAGWYEDTVCLADYGSLTCAEFVTAPIRRVVLRQTQTDNGWAYPEGEEEKNTLILQGNPLFAADSREIARRLLGQVEGFCHTPFACTLLPGQEVAPGCLVQFTDPDGNLRIGAVMRWEKHNGVLTVRGTGSHSLQSVQAFNELTLEDLEGQVLNISRTARGLQVSHTDLLGNVGALELKLDRVTSRVTGVEQDLTSKTTELSQTANGLTLAVSRLTGSLDGKTDREEFSRVTEHFTFNEEGMTVRNSATGMGIAISESQVAFFGGESPSTRIRPDSMESTRLSVDKGLTVGNFSLLPRTAGNLSFRFTGNASGET